MTPVLVTTPTGRTVTVHFNSWLARCLKPGSVNNGVTLNAHHIYFARNYCTKYSLAHEIGHTNQAAVLGWKYLPWVMGCLLRYGYAHSPAELAADAYMDAHADEFTAL